MNSKRELLMAGVPELSTQAFVRNGRNIRPQIGGGGGGSKQPSHTTQTVNNVPAFIQPYIESMLGRTQALGTDAQYEPFDPSQRFEGTTGLQQQSYNMVAGMQPAGQLDAATQTAAGAINQAGQAGVNGQGLMNNALFYGAGAANMGNNYNQMATNPGAVGQFMSPYMQNVVDVQKNEAIRDYQAQLPQMQAAATNAGAFGGSRHAILQAEGQRNLNQNLSDIQARGQQSAYEQAMQNMQFGQNLGMQGFQTALQGVGQGINAAQLGLQGANTQLQGANTLGQLGQTQFNQQMGIAELLNAMGTQQQQQGQQRRDFEYQQYIDELNFPYQQLAFMSDMTRGLPLSQSTVYQNSAGPNMTSQLIGGGLAAYGMMNRAKGGKVKPVKKYAEGGQVDSGAFAGLSVDETTATLEALSDEQLAQYASTVQDAVTLSLIKAENERRARMRQQPAQMPQSTVAQDQAMQAAQAGGGGIAAMMRPEVEDTQRPQPAYQSGGIVALAEGGTPGNAFSRAWQRILDMNNVDYGASFRGPREPTPEELERAATYERLAQHAQQIPVDPRSIQMAAPSAEMGPPIRVDIAGVPNQPPPVVPGTQLAPRPVETDAERDSRVFGPLEQSVAANARPAPVPVQATPTAAASAPAQQAGTGAPATYEDYMRTVDERATQTLEEKMAIDAMRAGLDERQARVLAQDRRGKMDALIAAGAAMMQGRTLPEGIALAGEAGVKALRDATDTQLKLEEGLARAQDEQRKYELALQKDNRKEARDSYDKFLRYDQQNVQFAAELDLKRAQLAQNYALGSERNRIAASNARGEADYRKIAAIETRIAALPEVRAYEDALKNPEVAQFQPGRIDQLRMGAERARAEAYRTFGMEPLGGSGGYDGGAPPAPAAPAYDPSAFKSRPLGR